MFVPKSFMCLSKPNGRFSRLSSVIDIIIVEDSGFRPRELSRRDNALEDLSSIASAYAIGTAAEESSLVTKTSKIIYKKKRKKKGCVDQKMLSSAHIDCFE